MVVCRGRSDRGGSPEAYGVDFGFTEWGKVAVVVVVVVASVFKQHVLLTGDESAVTAAVHEEDTGYTI